MCTDTKHCIVLDWTLEIVRFIIATYPNHILSLLFYLRVAVSNSYMYYDAKSFSFLSRAFKASFYDCTVQHAVFFGLFGQKHIRVSNTNRPQHDRTNAG